MPYPLFEGSHIGTPKAYDCFHPLIMKQRADLLSAVKTLVRENVPGIASDADYKHVRLMSEMPSIPASEKPDALRKDCADIMKAALILLDDPTVTFGGHDVMTNLDTLRTITERRHDEVEVSRDGESFTLTM